MSENSPLPTMEGSLRLNEDTGRLTILYGGRWVPLQVSVPELLDWLAAKHDEYLDRAVEYAEKDSGRAYCVASGKRLGILEVIKHLTEPLNIKNPMAGLRWKKDEEGNKVLTKVPDEELQREAEMIMLEATPTLVTLRDGRIVLDRKRLERLILRLLQGKRGLDVIG